MLVQIGELAARIRGSGPPSTRATPSISDAAPTRKTLGGIVEAARQGRGQGRVIAMLNIKGGVGKTVLAANLVRGGAPG